MFLIINFLKKKQAALVFFITFLIYSPLLLNHYVGDDSVIIERNTFYHSWKNIPRVFGEGSVFNAQAVYFNNELRSDFGTGKDSYRPISDLSYFIDYYLFKAKPFGSHLINILIHCVNAVLVYWIVNLIFSSSVFGVFAGLLFSLHPIQSEAVAVMSLRADILAALFVLCSFYCWIKFKEGGYVGKKYYAGSLIMYFLALFTKESAFILPLVILLFDQVLGSPRLGLKQRGICYLGFIPIFILFLYLYFVVFPSPLAALRAFHWLGGSFVNHCLIMGQIWFSYLINILMPWTVKMMPGHYCPSVPGVVTAEIGMALIVFITILYRFWRSYKECAFFLLWYLVFYLPISNLIPIANPVACHYMYLPSIGLLIVLAFFLDKVFKSTFLKKYSQSLLNILYVAIIMFCVTRTLVLNDDWKSDCDRGYAWIRDYPTDYQGYAMLGELYFNAGDVKKAKEYLGKSVLLNNQMPSDVLILAESYRLLGKSSIAESLLKQIILRHPNYQAPLFFLGEIYYDQKNNQQAQEVLEKALLLDPTNPAGYSLLKKVYLNLHKFESARNLLKRADFYLNEQNAL